MFSLALWDIAIIVSARIIRVDVFCHSHVRCAGRQSELFASVHLASPFVQLRGPVPRGSFRALFLGSFKARTYPILSSYGWGNQEAAGGYRSRGPEDGPGR